MLSPISRSAGQRVDEAEGGNEQCPPDKIPYEDELLATEVRDAEAKTPDVVPFQESKNVLNTRASQNPRQGKLVRKPKKSDLQPRFLKSANQHNKENGFSGYKFSANSLKKRSPGKDHTKASCNPFSFFTPKAPKFYSYADPSPAETQEHFETVVQAFPVFGGYLIGSGSSKGKKEKVANDENRQSAAENPECRARHERKRTAQFKQEARDQENAGEGQNRGQRQEQAQGAKEQVAKHVRRTTTLKDIMNHRSSSIKSRASFRMRQSSIGSSAARNQAEDAGLYEASQTHAVIGTADDNPNAKHLTTVPQDDTCFDESSTMKSMRRTAAMKRIQSPLGALLNHRSPSGQSSSSAQRQ